jgi:hypothetical protein
LDVAMENYVYVCRVCGAAFKTKEFNLSDVTLLTDLKGPAGQGIAMIRQVKSSPFTKISKEEFLAERLIGRQEMELLCSDSCCIKDSERYRLGVI